jgi:hypothetical protein
MRESVKQSQGVGCLAWMGSRCLAGHQTAQPSCEGRLSRRLVTSVCLSRAQVCRHVQHLGFIRNGSWIPTWAKTPASGGWAWVFQSIGATNMWRQRPWQPKWMRESGFFKTLLLRRLATATTSSKPSLAPSRHQPQCDPLHPHKVKA